MRRQRMVRSSRMSKVVNLNRFRKQKARTEADVLAAANRVKFGRTKEQKARDATLERDAQLKLDQLRREPERAPERAPGEDLPESS
jgi:hypothetical protein